MTIVYQLSLNGSAYDARGKTWPQVTSETGCKPCTEWVDPIHNRSLLIGEFGCSVSHLRAWEEIASSNLNGIILEEDATFHSFNPNHVDHLLESYDSVWLGYRWNGMGYWYNCHAYAITPDTARLLVKDFRHQIIPADEWVPMTLKNKRNYFYPEEVIKQIPRSTRPSTIEDTEMLPVQQNDVHVLAVGTDDEQCWALNKSAEAKGIKVLNLGLESEAFDMTGFGGMPKIELVKEHLKGLPSNDIVLFMDGYDTFFADNLETIKERFIDFDVDILFSAEESCWPITDNEFFRSRWKDGGTPYKYLNSGVYMGRVEALIAFFDLEESMSHNGDDQLFCQMRYLSCKDNQFPYRVALDYEAYIFQSHDTSVQKVGKQLSNKRTHCCGCIYHGNGGEDAKSFFKTMAAKFGYIKGVSSAPINKLDYKEVAREVLVVPLLSEEQCKDLIHKSEQLGNWRSMEGDKVPAQEIRIKELGLWEEYEAMWENHLAKVCETHWSPVLHQGLRDAFTMRYSMDTQKSLGLHTDASLITGSVKLNDDYEGATLHFPRQEFNNNDVPVGSCILFPAQVTHGHYVDELRSGVKYSLTMWTSRYSGDLNC